MMNTQATPPLLEELDDDDKVEAGAPLQVQEEAYDYDEDEFAPDQITSGE